MTPARRNHVGVCGVCGSNVAKSGIVPGSFLICRAGLHHLDEGRMIFASSPIITSWREPSAVCTVDVAATWGCSVTSPEKPPTRPRPLPQPRRHRDDALNTLLLPGSWDVWIGDKGSGWNGIFKFSAGGGASWASLDTPRNETPGSWSVVGNEPRWRYRADGDFRGIMAQTPPTPAVAWEPPGSWRSLRSMGMGRGPELPQGQLYARLEIQATPPAPTRGVHGSRWMASRDRGMGRCRPGLPRRQRITLRNVHAMRHREGPS
jgi:hypothetical protein